MGPNEHEFPRGKPGDYWNSFPACNSAMNYESNPRSAAYIPISERKRYYRGGLFGGTTENMIYACKCMADWMDTDAKNGVTAIVWDESHVNRFQEVNV